MTHIAWTLLALYLILLFSWFFLSEIERRSRPDANIIPRYFITDVGNTLGLTLAFVAALPNIHNTSEIDLIISYGLGLWVSYQLNQFWKKRSKEKTIGLYRNGKPTKAGKIHFVFMCLVCGTTLSMLFTGAVFNEFSQLSFALATIVYWGSFAVDHFFRKVL